MYKEDVLSEVGTMYATKEHILRHSVLENMMLAFDANKDFFQAFFQCYVI